MKEFEGVIGNDHVKKYLSCMLKKDHVPNSLLFSGPEGSGKHLFARHFAAMIFGSNEHLPRILSGNHPDVHEYYPEGKTGMHGIDSLRAFCDEVYMQPFETKRKVFIIHDADRMLKTAANALLKTFEEPSKDSVIILLTNQRSLIIETILSRCYTIHFHAHGKEQIKSVVREKVLEKLGSLKFENYTQFLTFIKELESEMEVTQTEAMEHFRAEIKEKGFENMSAAEKQHVEKELEGIGALKLQEEADLLFEVIAGWIRDLHLLRLGGRADLLVHEELKGRRDEGALLSLESVLDALHDAKLALARSTGLGIVLENLFLRLGVV